MDDGEEEMGWSSLLSSDDRRAVGEGRPAWSARRQLRRTTVSRSCAIFGSVRRGTGTGEASEDANAATRSWGTLALKLAHHRYGAPRTGSAHACQPRRSSRGSPSWMSG